MPRVLHASLLLPLVVALPTCSSDSFQSESSEAAAAPSETTSASLSGLAVTSPACGTASEGQVAECRTCAEAQCAPNLSECFGEAYLTTLDGGVCQAFGQCVMACACGDQVCYQACLDSLSTTGPAPCTDCLGRLLSCETANCSQLCAGGAADAGADAAKRGQ
jgi:hypothetical protein